MTTRRSKADIRSTSLAVVLCLAAFAIVTIGEQEALASPMQRPPAGQPVVSSPAALASSTTAEPLGELVDLDEVAYFEIARPARPHVEGDGRVDAVTRHRAETIFGAFDSPEGALLLTAPAHGPPSALS